MFRRFCLLLLLAVAPAMAQFSSAIQGTITDPSNAAIPEARVSVKNNATGIVREAITAADGNYRISSLGPGTYTLTVQKAGFTTQEQKAVTVAVSEVAKVDLSLNVGALTERIDVVATEVLVETEEGRVSGRIENSQLKELPINGRNILNLVAIQPGVVGRGLSAGLYSGGGSDTFSGETQPAVYASGQRFEGNNYTLDDTSVNGAARNGVTNVVPNSEATEEVRVVANNFSAVDGRNPGAQVQMITKSGTNELHGVAAYYFTDNELAARTIFDPARLPSIRKHLFDFAGGGPIVHNRTFAFISYEGLRQGGAATASTTVWTQQFANYVEQTFPNSKAAYIMSHFQPAAFATTNLRDLGTPTALGVNVTNPTPLGIPQIGTAFFTPLAFRNANQVSIRVDHELRPDKDRIYGSYFRTTNRTLAGGAFPDFNAATDEYTYYGNFNYTHTFSSNKVNEFRAGMNQLVGYPDLRPHRDIPGIAITGMGTVSGTSYPNGWWQTSFDFKDVFNWVHANHNLKLGGELRRSRGAAQNTSNYIPAYTFANILNFADDEPLQMTRLVNPATGVPTTVFSQLRNWEWALFVQDDWKVSRRLTLNLGLRYETFGTWDDKQNTLSNLVLGSGAGWQQGIATGKASHVDQFYPTYRKNFDPRLGFAWDPTGRGKMSVRGGYGIVNDRMATLPIENYRSNPPLKGQVSVGLLLGTPNFTYSFGDTSKPYVGYPVDAALQIGLDANNGLKGARVSIQGADTTLRTPYIQNWFLGIQRELLHNTVVEVNYIGSAGHRLYNDINLNRFAGDLLATGSFHGLNQSFSSITLLQSGSNSSYNGMTASVKHVFQKSFTLQGNYTFGKAIDDTDGETGSTGWQDAWNRKAERGLAGFDVRNRVNIAGIWDMPFFKGSHSVASNVLGGWALSLIGITDSGSPINVTNGAAFKLNAAKTANTGGDYNADGSGGDRPNAPTTMVQTVGFSKQQFLTGVLPASVFPAPGLGMDGNLGRDVFRGPGFLQVDLAADKNFKIGERISATLRGEALNALNRTNLQNPSMDLNSVNFGKSTGQYTARLFEVSLRIRF
jgi:Carboxypeptidase regulatory-like domain/TonB dependent receptor